LDVWRATSLVTSVAAVALALTLAAPRPALPPIVVVLSAPAPISPAASGERESAAFVASISADGRSMVTKPLSRVSLQADRSLELWALPPQGAPRSLGVISTSQATVVERGQLLRGTDAFAVTLEPAGGSPSGAPTGPVLYVGKLVL
jgi:anti-sigma-K factor RskA